MIVIEVQLRLGDVLVQVWRGDGDVTLDSVRPRSDDAVWSLTVSNRQ